MSSRTPETKVVSAEAWTPFRCPLGIGLEASARFVGRGRVVMSVDRSTPPSAGMVSKPVENRGTPRGLVTFRPAAWSRIRPRRSVLHGEAPDEQRVDDLESAGASHRAFEGGKAEGRDEGDEGCPVLGMERDR